MKGRGEARVVPATCKLSLIKLPSACTVWMNVGDNSTIVAKRSAIVLVAGAYF